MRVRFLDFSYSAKAQSKAESPPPTIVISLSKKFSIFLSDFEIGLLELDDFQK